MFSALEGIFTDKKVNLALIIIIVLLVSSLSVAIICLEDGDDNDTPKGTMDEFADSYNDKDYEKWIGTTTMNFYPEEEKETVVAWLNDQALNATLTVLSMKDWTNNGSIDHIAINNRIDYWEGGLNITVQSWSAQKIDMRVTENGVPENRTVYGLFFKIEGSWYVDYDSIRADLNDWNEDWGNKVINPSGAFESFICISKHVIELGITGFDDEGVVLTDMEIVVTRLDIAGDNSSSFMFFSSSDGTRSASTDWTYETGEVIKMQPDAFTYIDGDEDGHFTYKDHLTLQLDMYIPGATYSFTLIYMPTEKNLCTMTETLFDYVFQPTYLNVSVTQIDDNSYKFVQTSYIPKDNAISGITFIFMEEEGGIGTSIDLGIGENGTSYFTGYKNYVLLDCLHLTEDSVVLTDTDGDGYFTQGDYFVITFIDGTDRSNVMLWIDDGTYQSILYYYW